MEEERFIRHSFVLLTNMRTVRSRKYREYGRFGQVDKVILGNK